ncbi:NAD(P)H-binding protein [Rhodoferax sp. TBRC 17660]|uniref:NAD(P)H-binding protein n=1 Tax=Rhodoferax potami TaxID=3068338 RepID=A0ABU3KT66_9BURK|nr:NAD(P)H-binding protein [Rhodoferax sp. TBRC 17660]MDT7520513.1 NAD(P)H-binding protein [Rhodoferax sp. TBRC 17660]
MKKFAVIGASSGTGLEIVRLLASSGQHVRAISRRPLPATELIEPYSADVTEPNAIARALDGDFDAVFFTADIHKRFASRQEVRSLMFDGFMNSIHAAKKHTKHPKIVLLSVIGPDKPSWVWHLLNLAKRGMQKNVVDREAALAQSGLPYVIVRAARLVNADDTTGQARAIAVTPATHRLDMKRTIARRELAKTLMAAAKSAPHGSIWDVFEDDDGSIPVWLRASSQ